MFKHLESLLGTIKAVEDAVIHYIFNIELVHDVDPFAYCSHGFNSSLTMIKTSASFKETYASNDRLCQTIEKLQLEYAIKPVEIIRLCIRVFAIDNIYKMNLVVLEIQKCLRKLADKSRRMDIGEFVFDVESMNYDVTDQPEVVALQLLNIDKVATKAQFVSSTERIFVDVAGNRKVRGYYTICNASMGFQCPCFSSENDYLLLRTRSHITTGRREFDSLYAWQIIHRKSKVVFYTCIAKDYSEIPPSQDWLVSNDGTYPAPVVLVVPLSLTLTSSHPALVSFQYTDPVVTNAAERKPHRWLREKTHINTRAPVAIFTHEDCEKSSLCAGGSDPTKSTLTEIISPDFAELAPLSLAFIPSGNRMECIPALQVEINDAHSKVEWFSHATAKQLCEGFAGSLDPQHNLEVSCHDSFRTDWLLSNMLKVQSASKYKSIANISRLQLNSYMQAVTHMLCESEQERSHVSALGIDVYGSCEKQSIEYIIRLDMAYFSRLSDSVKDIFKLAHQSVDDIFANSEDDCMTQTDMLSADVEDEDNIGIGMGFDEEVIQQQDSLLSYLEVSSRVNRCGQILNAATAEVFASGVELDSRKVYTIRKGLASLCSFHEELAKLCDKDTIDLELPHFPDPFTIGEMEESIIRNSQQLFTVETDTFVGIRFTHLNSSACGIESDLQLDVHLFNSLRQGLEEIQKYMENMVLFFENIDKEQIANTELVSEVGCIFANFLFSEVPTPIVPITRASGFDGFAKRYCWSQYLFRQDKGVLLDIHHRTTRDSLHSFTLDSDLLCAQNGKCFGCGIPIFANDILGGMIWHKCNYRRCEFIGALFCKRWCHRNEQHALPFKILSSLDFSKYSVCQQSCVYLNAVWNKPIISLSLMHPEVVENLSTIGSIVRTRVSILKHMERILQIALPFEKAVEDTLGLSRVYMCFTTELFSLADLSSTSLKEVDEKLLLLLETLHDL